MDTAGGLEAGRSALRQGRWEDARAAFASELAERETPEALEGIAEALWWLCQAPSSVRYRERAYIGFRREGRTERACRAAVDLSISYLVNLGNEAAARGWLARAESLSQPIRSDPMQGWLWLMHGFLSRDVDQARVHLSNALDIARIANDRDLELVALSDLGLVLVKAGQIERGLRMLDEAMAGTLGGEYSRLDTVVFTTCNMLAACSVAGDLERATQWCKVADGFMRDHGSPFLFARCRVHYGNVLVKKGHWARAEAELRAALDMSQDAGPGPKSEARARLADLRVRQGRLEEAEMLLTDFDDPVAGAVPLAALHLARGQPTAAVGILERCLKHLDDGDVEAPATLAMLVQAQIAFGDVDSAAKAAARLETIAATQERGQASALASLATARVKAAVGDADEAIVLFEMALDRFSRLDLPLEAARARLESAKVSADGHPQLAIVEAKSALAAFEELGAMPDADEAASLLRALGSAGRTGPKNVGALTKREQEVVRLVGLGLSNPEIAQRLFISRKTAAHHVSNVLAKLGLRNRAEIVAYAAREFAGGTAS